MLRIIDTNYAIRYLLQDDYKLALEAKEIIDEGAYILPESINEMIYVFNKGYKISRKDTTYAIMDLLQDVDTFDKNLYIEALRTYRDSKFDFVDCLLFTRKKILGDKVYTLDKKLRLELDNIKKTSI